jgi:hypothetical protein
MQYPARNPLRGKTNFPSEINLIWQVQMGAQKYSALPVGQIIAINSPVPPD